MNLYLAVIRKYNQASHTADVTISTSQTDVTVPLSHSIQWWQCTPGNYAIIAMPNDTDTQTACLLALWSTDQPPLDPHFDPSIGHKHTGDQDDAPTL